MNELLMGNANLDIIFSLFEVAVLSLLLLNAARLIAGRAMAISSMVILSAFAAFVFYSEPEKAEGMVLGVAAALLLLLPLERKGILSGNDFAASIPVGALLGPISFGIVFAISAALIIVQKLTGSEMEISPTYMFGSGKIDALPKDVEERSALAEIEARRLFDIEYQRGENARTSMPSVSRKRMNELVPWTLKIMFASIVVLFLGIVG